MHDKVEFEIILSCYTLDIEDRLKDLQEKNFTKRECDQIQTSLRNLTNRIIHPKDGLWRIDIEKISTLNERRKLLEESNLDITEKIYWLLEDGKRYGTLPFAGLARAGFIAVQMLKSFVNIGLFSEKDYDAFISSLTTVSGQLSRDRSLLEKSKFLSKYGHLRPRHTILHPKDTTKIQTFILIGKYREDTDVDKDFTLTIKQMRSISVN